MDIVVIVALVIGALVCLLPGIMAWSHYAGSKEKAARKTTAVRTTRRVATEHVC